MKVLWLTNIMLPKVANNVGIEPSPLGGWLDGISNELLKDNKIELIMCFPLKEKILDGEIDNLKYYSFDARLNKCDIELIFEEILLKEKPDIIHIFGTEKGHSLYMVNIAGKINAIGKVIVSIQGLVSIYAKHYYGFLPAKIICRQTLRDIIKNNGFKAQAKDFENRGKNEISTIKKVENVSGRTDWDRACVTQINPNVKYYFCNETLRDMFYNFDWEYEKCQRHSIFISQGNYPIKGLHIALEAMKIILEKYPNAHIYTTGYNPLNANFKQKLKQTYYNKYIGRLIKKYNVENNITFLGFLDENKMCEQFLKANVFVSASTIENSPNSVGEAMILGVPTISSMVGGINNMLNHNVDGFLYQADAPYMLAYYINKIFESRSLAEIVSKNSKEHASATHNKDVNRKNLISIYNEIITKNEG